VGGGGGGGGGVGGGWWLCVCGCVILVGMGGFFCVLGGGGWVAKKNKHLPALYDFFFRLWLVPPHDPNLSNATVIILLQRIFSILPPTARRLPGDFSSPNHLPFSRR